MLPKYNWMLMKILIGADHAGFPLKQQLVEQLQASGHQVEDLGAAEFDANDDYPDFALAVAHGVADGQGERGIIVCGSGVGATIAANKVKGARASVCHDTYSAYQGVEHDAMNILCLGARVIGQTLAEKVVEAFLDATFSPEERHSRRLGKIQHAEENF